MVSLEFGARRAYVVWAVFVGEETSYWKKCYVSV